MKKLCHFCNCAKFEQDGLLRTVSILAITFSSEVQMRCSLRHWKAKRQSYNFHEDTLYKFRNCQARRRPTRPNTFSSKHLAAARFKLAGGAIRDFQIRKFIFVYVFSNLFHPKLIFYPQNILRYPSTINRSL